MMPNKPSRSSRRYFLLTAGAGIAGASLAASGIARPGRYPEVKEMLVYVGTYTSGGSEGIYILKLDLLSGKLSLLQTVKGVVEPSFLSIDRQRRYLYAVNETTEFDGKPSGAVSAFSIDQASGGLKFLDQVPSLGGAPCHIAVTNNGRYVLVANYMGGNVSVFPVRSDGGLDRSVNLVQHVGTGPNKERQESAHVHSITLDSKNNFAFVADLGIDKIMIYRFDDKTGKLEPNTPGSLVSKPGAGPRHFTFDQSGKFAYVINELDCTISALSYDEEKGILKEIQTVTTLPANYSGANTCADIHISPSGKFLYGSNRGHDSIASYSIDKNTGKLTFIEHVSTGGKTPRNFAIDPTGTYLLAANQNSGTITLFKIDKDSGKLKSSGQSIQVPAPVCLKLIPRFP
jgi:6-phosphogluconolactonase